MTSKLEKGGGSFTGIKLLLTMALPEDNVRFLSAVRELL